MRYVFYAAAAVVVMLGWLNHTPDGKRIKRQMLDHPEESARLY
ncbi:hypothetical protein [Novosphingobium sp.]